MEPSLNIALRAARKAGDHIMESLERPHKITIDEKKSGGLVTSVDIDSEHMIIETLRNSFPDAGFICEESEIIPPKSDMIWIIDPIDGTNNFIHNFPYFAISIACQINSKLEHGLIFNPVTQDVYTGSRGKGAQKNNNRIRASNPANLKGALTLHQAMHDYVQQDQYIKLIRDLKNAGCGIRQTGSIALDLANVAAGSADIFFTAKPKIWDYAAASVIAREAGAVICDLKGGTDFGEENGIIAAGAKTMASFLKLIRNINHS